MASPAAAAPAASPSPTPAPISRSWKGWLLIGACFGLGYGITQRLVSIRLESGLNGIQRFEVKSFPGTELNSLRRRFGDDAMQIRGDLDLLELERQQKQDAASIEERRSSMEDREQQQQQSPDQVDQQPAASSGDDAPLPEAPALPPLEPEPTAPASTAVPAAPGTPGTTP